MLQILFRDAAKHPLYNLMNYNCNCNIAFDPLDIWSGQVSRKRDGYPSKISMFWNWDSYHEGQKLNLLGNKFPWAQISNVNTLEITWFQSFEIESAVKEQISWESKAKFTREWIPLSPNFESSSRDTFVISPGRNIWNISQNVGHMVSRVGNVF